MAALADAIPSPRTAVTPSLFVQSAKRNGGGSGASVEDQIRGRELLLMLHAGFQRQKLMRSLVNGDPGVWRKLANYERENRLEHAESAMDDDEVQVAPCPVKTAGGSLAQFRYQTPAASRCERRHKNFISAAALPQVAALRKAAEEAKERANQAEEELPEEAAAGVVDSSQNSFSSVGQGSSARLPSVEAPVRTAADAAVAAAAIVNAHQSTPRHTALSPGRSRPLSRKSERRRVQQKAALTVSLNVKRWQKRAKEKMDRDRAREEEADAPEVEDDDDSSPQGAREGEQGDQAGGVGDESTPAPRGASDPGVASGRGRWARARGSVLGAVRMGLGRLGQEGRKSEGSVPSLPPIKVKSEEEEIDAKESREAPSELKGAALAARWRKAHSLMQRAAASKQRPQPPRRESGTGEASALGRRDGRRVERQSSYSGATPRASDAGGIARRASNDGASGAAAAPSGGKGAKRWRKLRNVTMLTPHASTFAVNMGAWMG